MSLDQSQYGEFRFNKTNFAKFSTKLRAKINDYHDYSFAVANAYYTLLKFERIKADNASDFLERSDVLWKVKQQARDSKWSKFDICRDLAEFILEEIYRSKSNKNAILKPRRSAFPKIKNTAKVVGIDFNWDQVSIFTDPDTLSVTWKIQMGNRNVDRVDGKFYSSLLFPLLNQHKWGKGEGGYIKDTEESTSDCEYDDRYNTNCHYFLGEIGEDKKQGQHRMAHFF